MLHRVCWLLPLIFAYMSVHHNVGAHSSLLASLRAKVWESLCLRQDRVLHFFLGSYTLVLRLRQIKVFVMEQFWKSKRAGKELDILDLQFKKWEKETGGRRVYKQDAEPGRRIGAEPQQFHT